MTQARPQPDQQSDPQGNEELEGRYNPQHISRWHRLRYRLGQHDAALPLALVAIPCGIITGLIINSFRFGIEFLSDLFLLQKDPASQPPVSGGVIDALLQPVFLLPVCSALVLGLICQLLSADSRHTGLSHVLVRLHKFNAHMPFRNAVVQFFAGMVALGSGHSGGREGPAIHIGASANGFLANKFHLPNNSIRILIACGAASAIAASFNTPIAGVIFAIEVIMMEYTLVSFVPIAISSIIATTITQLLMGNESVFSVPPVAEYSLWEIPTMVLLGLGCGLAAIAFMRIQLITQKLISLPVSVRFLFAGLVTGSIALSLPQVLGIGYEHVNAALSNQLNWQILFWLCLAKITASAITNGVGMPVGIIGPSLVIGASLGGLMGLVMDTLTPSLSSGMGFYSLLGMGGVMAALLNAPLAALIAILELARTPEALLPGIIVILIASLCTDQIFGQQSVVETVLRRQGILLREHPVAQALNRLSLSAVTDTNIAYLNGQLYAGQLKLIANSPPRHIVICNLNDRYFLVTRNQFLGYIDSLNDLNAPPPKTAQEIYDQFHEFDIELTSLVPCDVTATVTEARQLLNSDDSIAGLFVHDSAGPFQGILRKATLNRLIDSW